MTMNIGKLTRDRILQALVGVFKPLDYVHAFYEGGAAAFDRVDEWSDIDVYIVVDDEKVEETFLVFEKALKSLSPIKQKYKLPQPPYPGVYQAFYRLENTSDFLLLDLAVLQSTSPDKFLEPEIHGNVVFYFNRSKEVRCAPLDKDALVRKIMERIARLKARFDMFNCFVQKEINRGNHLEALDLYHMLTLASLVEALRMRHNPVHYDFKMRYVYCELPQRTVQRLERLSFVKNSKDLQKKYREAIDWFHKVTSEIEEKNVERLVGKA